MTQELTELFGQFLEFAKYFVKTGIGISQEFYYHSVLSAIFGSGQGSVELMYIWGCFVSCLVDIHEKKGFEAPYAPPLGIDEGLIRSTIILILSFVDN